MAILQDVHYYASWVLADVAISPVAAQCAHLLEEPPQALARTALVILQLLLQDFLGQADLAEHLGSVASAVVVLVRVQVARQQLVTRGQHGLENI
jgi:hypothetical protein